MAGFPRRSLAKAPRGGPAALTWTAEPVVEHDSLFVRTGGLASIASGMSFINVPLLIAEDTALAPELPNKVKPSAKRRQRAAMRVFSMNQPPSADVTEASSASSNRAGPRTRNVPVRVLVWHRPSAAWFFEGLARFQILDGILLDGDFLSQS